MRDKKKQILDAAIKCFAQKGFNATSIQEIVDELGMAKGSIYFYFKSKDDLLASVIEHYGEMLFEQMGELPEEAALPPREKLATQIDRQFVFIREHLDFMRMFAKEPLSGLQPQIREKFIRIRAREKVWNVKHLGAIYGSSAEKYFGDASALMSGIAGPYFEAILFEGESFENRGLGKFLTERLDDMVAGMVSGGKAPILPPANLQRLRELAGLDSAESSEAAGIVSELLAEAASDPSRWEERAYADLVGALTALKEEAGRSAVRHPLHFKAMIALTRQLGPAEWRDRLAALERLA
ncbi:TetR/AcrR family transcriptional regulator [Cohnella suwonensis]|uniref:TetR/AcrR family transcriptional regulator n=1 Tax=Cohnella suwonensis TaxID=696072 RepID=A0ABW0LW90_9BACL